MKIRIVLLTLISFLLIGCTNTINCNIKTYNFNSNIKIKFKNNKPLIYKYRDNMNFSKSSINKKDYYKEKYNKYNSLILNKNIKLINKKNYISTKINYNFKKDNIKQENILLIKRNYTKKQTLKKIKSLGYTCK